MILPLFGWGGDHGWKVLLAIVLFLSILGTVYVMQDSSLFESLGCAIDERFGFERNDCQ